MGIVDLGPRHIGWREDDAVVASLRVRREGDGIVIDSIEFGEEAHARALVDAVADVATAPWLAGSHGVLAACGFDHDGTRWVRGVAPVAAPAGAAAAVTLARLESAIRAAWGRDTSDEPELWRPDNPALGQCAVTALVVRDYLGGDILVAGVVADGRRVARHAWNRLPSGLCVDLTREQFVAGETFEEPRVAELLLTDRHPERSGLLRERVRSSLDAA